MTYNIDTILDAFKRELIDLYKAVREDRADEACHYALHGNNTLNYETELYVIKNEDGDYELVDDKPASPHATLTVSWGCFFDGCFDIVGSLSDDEIRENADNYVDNGANIIAETIAQQIERSR